MRRYCEFLTAREKDDPGDTCADCMESNSRGDSARRRWNTQEKSWTHYGRHNADVFARYGLRRIVNASGTGRRSRVRSAGGDRGSGAFAHSVDMAGYQSVATMSSRAVGAGRLVVNYHRGYLHDMAGCMTGKNLARIERLPDPEGLKNEVILQRGHNVTYGGYVEQHIRTIGATTIEIGAANECGVYQLEDAITDKTACALYVVSHHTVQSGLIDLSSFAAACHARGVPVIVDAAA